MAFLSPDKTRTEHGLVIKEKIIPWGAEWTKNWGSFKIGYLFKADRLLSNGTGKPKKITIHNTADIVEAKGTNDAEQYARATWPNQNMGDARVHYFIDETDCWQLLREDEVGWHAGDGRGPGNETSIAIEIIMSGKNGKDDIEAEERGALLTAILLNRHGLTINDVVPHRKWSGKNCPIYILPHWDKFIAKVENYLKSIKNPVAEKVEGNIKVGDLVKMQKDAPVFGQTKTFKSWVYDSNLYVREINGSRVVVSTLKTGAVTGAVDKKYLTKI